MHTTPDAVLLGYTIASQWEAPDVIFFKLLGVLLIVAVNGFFVIAEFSIVKIRSSQLDSLIEKATAAPYSPDMSRSISMPT